MRRVSSKLRGLKLIIALTITAGLPLKLLGVELKAATIEAYARYVKATEARVNTEMARPGAFLYIDGLPVQQREQIRAELKSGQVYMARLKATDGSGQSIDAPEA